VREQRECDRVLARNAEDTRCRREAAAEDAELHRNRVADRAAHRRDAEREEHLQRCEAGRDREEDDGVLRELQPAADSEREQRFTEPLLACPPAHGVEGVACLGPEATEQPAQPTRPRHPAYDDGADTHDDQLRPERARQR